MNILPINEKCCSEHLTALVTWRDVTAAEEEQGPGQALFFPLLPFPSSAPTGGKPLPIISLDGCSSVSFGGSEPLLLLVLSASVPAAGRRSTKLGRPLLPALPTLNLGMRVPKCELRSGLCTLCTTYMIFLVLSSRQKSYLIRAKHFVKHFTGFFFLNIQSSPVRSELLPSCILKTRIQST